MSYTYKQKRTKRAFLLTVWVNFSVSVSVSFSLHNWMIISLNFKLYNCNCNSLYPNDLLVCSSVLHLHLQTYANNFLLADKFVFCTSSLWCKKRGGGIVAKMTQIMLQNTTFYEKFWQILSVRHQSRIHSESLGMEF